MKSLVLYCRAGFEQTCAQEIVALAHDIGVNGEASAESESGYVVFTAHNIELIEKRLSFKRLIFARQWIHGAQFFSELSVRDRLTPLIEHAKTLGEFGALVIEYPDTNHGKELSSFSRKFAQIFKEKAIEANILYLNNAKPLPQLHLFFVNPESCYVGHSWNTNASPYFMGIPRLKFPAGAPSRSTLKLAEAFICFLDSEEKQNRLRPSMTAIDIGAAPGGWTWQLVNRGLYVKAIDNGAMSREVLATEMVEHIRADGFKYKPRRSVNWMVCDMVDKPIKVAQLVAQWLAEGYCQDIIFNLKLPMKKRYEAIIDATDLITSILDKREILFELRFKHLYHDREEVTGYLCKVNQKAKAKKKF